MANERGQILSRTWVNGSVTVHGLSFGFGRPNNGNLVEQKINGKYQGTDFAQITQEFAYDSLNRLQVFKDTGLSACGSAATVCVRQIWKSGGVEWVLWEWGRGFCAVGFCGF